jgi:hypothetical protein
MCKNILLYQTFIFEKEYGLIDPYKEALNIDIQKYKSVIFCLIFLF